MDLSCAIQEAYQHGQLVHTQSQRHVLQVLRLFGVRSQTSTVHRLVGAILQVLVSVPICHLCRALIPTALLQRCLQAKLLTQSLHYLQTHWLR